MAKKQQTPDDIIKQFDKPQFAIADAVFFTWLGSKKYGYVTKIKKTTWGVMYTVESNNTRYPCGISIKGHKTAYTTGCIDVDETRAIGQDTLKIRIQTGHAITTAELFTDPARATHSNRNDATNAKQLSAKPRNRTQSTQSNNATKHVVKHGSNTNTSKNSKKRKQTKLDAAIQRQRNFLNGFITS